MAGLVNGTTVVLLGEKAVSRRVEERWTTVACCLVRRQLRCWVGGNWTAGREKGGATAALLVGRGLLRCWVGQRLSTVALLDGVGGRQLPRWVDNGCAARWERIGLLGGRRLGRQLPCWME
jgi:hypothetical protein